MLEFISGATVRRIQHHHASKYARPAVKRMEAAGAHLDHERNSWGDTNKHVSPPSKCLKVEENRFLGGKMEKNKKNCWNF